MDGGVTDPLGRVVHRQVGIGNSRLHPRQISSDAMLRVDSHTPPTASLIRPDHRLGITPVALTMTCSEVARDPARLEPLLVRTVHPGDSPRAITNLFRLADARPGTVTRIHRRQVMGYMVPLDLLRCG